MIELNDIQFRSFHSRASVIFLKNQKRSMHETFDKATPRRLSVVFAIRGGVKGILDNSDSLK